MTALVELRVLDGPNLYVSRPAVKLTLDAHELAGLPERTVQEIAKAAGLDAVYTVGPSTGQQRDGVTLRPVHELLTLLQRVTA